MREEQYQGTRTVFVCEDDRCGFRTLDRIMAAQHSRLNHTASDTAPATDTEESNAAEPRPASEHAS